MTAGFSAELHVQLYYILLLPINFAIWKQLYISYLVSSAQVSDALLWSNKAFSLDGYGDTLCGN